VIASVSYTLPDTVEDLTLNGIGLTGTGNDLDNNLFGSGMLIGGAGNDKLTGGPGSRHIDRRVTETTGSSSTTWTPKVTGGGGIRSPGDLKSRGNADLTGLAGNNFHWHRVVFFMRKRHGESAHGNQKTTFLAPFRPDQCALRHRGRPILYRGPPIPCGSATLGWSKVPRRHGVPGRISATTFMPPGDANVYVLQGMNVILS